MLDILFEDYYLLVVNKEAGLSAESGAARHPSAENQALMYFTEELNKKFYVQKTESNAFFARSAQARSSGKRRVGDGQNQIGTHQFDAAV